MFSMWQLREFIPREGTQLAKVQWELEEQLAKEEVEGKSGEDEAEDDEEDEEDKEDKEEEEDEVEEEVEEKGMSGKDAAVFWEGHME